MKRPRQKWFLRQWRKARGLTLERLAGRLEISVSYLSELERGVHRYNQDQLEALATALDLEPADLIMRDPSQPNALWSIWDNVRDMSPEQQAQALRLIDALRDPPPKKKDTA